MKVTLTQKRRETFTNVDACEITTNAQQCSNICNKKSENIECLIPPAPPPFVEASWVTLLMTASNRMTNCPELNPNHPPDLLS